MEYHVGTFISHSWKYSGHYNTLRSWLDESWNINGTPLFFPDTSVPKDNPIHFANNDLQLKKAIYERVSVSSVIIIPTGMYINYSKWIKKEIEGAGLYNKPILAVNPWGAQRKSTIVADNAAQTVGWTKKSVINATWKLYRGT